MQLAYPNFLADTKPEDIRAMKKLWYQELSVYPSNKVEVAMQRLTKEHPTFAPTLGEFLALVESVFSRSKEPRIGRSICSNCKSYDITQRHHDMCVLGIDVDPKFTKEQLDQTKAFVEAIRRRR